MSFKNSFSLKRISKEIHISAVSECGYGSGTVQCSKHCKHFASSFRCLSERGDRYKNPKAKTKKPNWIFQSQKALCLPQKMMRVSKEPLVFFAVNQQRSEQDSRRKRWSKWKVSFKRRARSLWSTRRENKIKVLCFSTTPSTNRCAMLQTFEKRAKKSFAKPRYLPLYN